jgi:hypothetical protein
MRKLLVLFNHSLTPAQYTDAEASLGITKVLLPSEELSWLWANIPPEVDSLSTALTPVYLWLAECGQPGDYVLIQGEFGATTMLVQEALRLGLKPVYATTERRAVEERMENGDIQLSHCFRHVRFRQYEVKEV